MGTPKGTQPWNAGTSKGWTDKRGYRWLYVSENGRKRARREHRVVVERQLGRRLEPWELVHHKDGNKLNNDPANLEVQEFGTHSAEHHRGSRRDEDAKRSIQAFAQMREEIAAERRIKLDLLEALELIFLAVPDDVFRSGVHAGADDIARAAIAKARGGAL